MKLQRESINLGSEYRGQWSFSIRDNNEEALISVEKALNSIVVGVRGDGREITWRDYCDLCPLYDEGISSGYMIPVEMVDDFKADFKKAKKMK